VLECHRLVAFGALTALQVNVSMLLINPIAGAVHDEIAAFNGTELLLASLGALAALVCFCLLRIVPEFVSLPPLPARPGAERSTTYSVEGGGGGGGSSAQKSRKASPPHA
jgi:hypothetical protein